MALTALLFASCGDSAASDADQDAPTASATDTGPLDPIDAPAQAAQPAGSLGTFTLYYIRGSGNGADTTAIEGFLPPAIPQAAVASAPLDAVPTYTVSVKPSTLSDDVDLKRNGFVYVAVDEVGEAEAKVRWASNIFPERQKGLYRGTAHVFTFPPLWTAASATPELWLRDKDKEDLVLAEMMLPITAAPAWAQPVTLPTVPEGIRVRIRADLRLAEDGLTPVFIYPSTFGDIGWGADALDVERTTLRRRERSGQTDLGTPYRAAMSNVDVSRGEAFLVLLRP